MDDTLTPAELHDLLARSRAERNALRAEVERLRKALTEIAAFNDIWANGELFMCGSYSSFDEPHSVQTARAALATVAVSRDDDA